MRWLDGMCAPRGPLGRRWDAIGNEASWEAKKRAAQEMVVAFGRAGARLLGAGAFSNADKFAAIARLAAAYERPDFPRLLMAREPRNDKSLSWSGWPHPPARWIVRWWVGALLSHLPRHTYKVTRSIGHYTIERPAHHRLLELLSCHAGASLASAVLYLWAQTFGQNAEKHFDGVFEPAYLDKGSEQFFLVQSGLLRNLVRSLADPGMPTLPLQSVAICLAAGLRDSQEQDTTPSTLDARLRDILEIAFPRTRFAAHAMPAILELPRDLSRLSPSVPPPDAVWSQTGTSAAKQDKVTAWFKQVISLLSPAEFAAQRASIYTLMLDRHKTAGQSSEAGPTSTSITAAAGQADRSATGTTATLSLDDREADDDLIERHTALHMLYASYTEALKPLLHRGKHMDRGRDDKGAAPGRERYLVHALALPCLHRHADLVAQEQAWLATWRDQPWASALGAGLIAVNLRQLAVQLHPAIGRDSGAHALAGRASDEARG